MNKYVLINVQGLSDITTKVFDSEKDLKNYLRSFFDDNEDDLIDQLTPYGKVCLDYQTLEVVEVKYG